MSDYGTPRKIEYYGGPDTNWQDVTSEREYIPVTSIRGATIDPYEPYSYRQEKMTDITLYLDPITGIVVWDIAAYEKNLGHRKPLSAEEYLAQYGDVDRYGDDL